MSSQNQFHLLRERRFNFYFLTQFLGAFNDNVYKNALIILFTYQTAILTLYDTHTLVNLSAGLFILPFFLFSATAGQLADKYEKSQLTRHIKFLEIIIMLLGTLGLYFNNVPLLITALFLMGTQSAFFGPIKYGYLPQHLRPHELIGGNALVETGTFLAILLGTLTGGILIALPSSNLTWVSTTVLTIALLGYLASRQIPITPAVAPNLVLNWNPFTETWRNLRFLAERRTLFLAVLGISWFWLIGGVYLAQLPNYTKLTLGGNEQVVTLLLTLFSLGIGLGSLLCDRLSDHKVEVGLVPLGALGITLFSLDLSYAYTQPTTSELLGITAFLQTPGSWRVLIDILLLSASGGLYIVPLYALIQQRTEPTHVSRVIASNNIVNAFFMVLSAILAIILLNLGMTIPQLFLTLAIANIFTGFYIFYLVPEFSTRFFIWLLIHLLYRVEKTNLDRLPEQGACLIISNHVSYLDALIIGGCLRRPVRFVMHYKIYQIPILNFIFKTAGAIPIAGIQEDKLIMETAFDQITTALQAGEVVGLFPEGRITRDGELQTFLPGLRKIIDTYPVPVLPMALCGLWGTFFSRERGTLKIPKRLWSKIALKIGDLIPPEQVTLRTAHQQISELRGNWK